MAVLQSIAGFLYEVQKLATYAYLPDIGRLVDERKMTSFTSTFAMLQFSAQAVFLVLIIAISLALKLGDVLTAQVSQGIDVVVLIIGFTIAWRMFPRVPQRHKLPAGRSLISAGFIQNWKTFIGINTHYGNGLRWFLIACTFASAGKL